MNIQTNKIGFNNLDYTLTALPLIPLIKLEGFDTDGINWDENEHSTLDKGADGLPFIIDKPIVYRGTFTLQANSSSRILLDELIELTTVRKGKRIVDYELILTVSNYTTGTKTIYNGGTLETASGGDNATKEGQQPKAYILSFSDRVTLPL